MSAWGADWSQTVCMQQHTRTRHSHISLNTLWSLSVNSERAVCVCTPWFKSHPQMTPLCNQTILIRSPNTCCSTIKQSFYFPFCCSNSCPAHKEDPKSHSCPALLLLRKELWLSFSLVLHTLWCIYLVYKSFSVCSSSCDVLEAL